MNSVPDARPARHPGDRLLHRDRRPLLHEAVCRRRRRRDQGREPGRRSAAPLVGDGRRSARPRRRSLPVPQRIEALGDRLSGGRSDRGTDRRRRSGRGELRARPHRGGEAAGEIPGADAAVDLALRTRRTLDASPVDGVHAAGGVRLHRRSRPRRARALPGGRPHHGVAGGRLRRRRRSGGGAARPAHRARRACRRLPARGDLARRQHLPRSLPQPLRPAASDVAGAHLGDAVDRADRRRMGRLQHQHRAAVPRLPAPHRAARPARRRGTGAGVRAQQALRRMECDCPRLHDASHDGGARGARRGAAHSRGPGARRRLGTAPRAPGGAWHLRAGSVRGVRASAPAVRRSTAAGRRRRDRRRASASTPAASSRAAATCRRRAVHRRHRSPACESST